MPTKHGNTDGIEKMEKLWKATKEEFWKLEMDGGSNLNITRDEVLTRFIPLMGILKNFDQITDERIRIIGEEMTLISRIIFSKLAEEIGGENYMLEYDDDEAENDADDMFETEESEDFEDGETSGGECQEYDYSPGEDHESSDSSLSASIPGNRLSDQVMARNIHGSAMVLWYMSKISPFQYDPLHVCQRLIAEKDLPPVVKIDLTILVLHALAFPASLTGCIFPNLNLMRSKESWVDKWPLIKKFLGCMFPDHSSDACDELLPCQVVDMTPYFELFNEILSQFACAEESKYPLWEYKLGLVFHSLGKIFGHLGEHNVSGLCFGISAVHFKRKEELFKGGLPSPFN